MIDAKVISLVCLQLIQNPMDWCVVCPEHSVVRMEYNPIIIFGWMDLR